MPTTHTSATRRVATHAGLPLLAIIVFGVLTTVMLVIGFNQGAQAFLWSLIPVTVAVAAAAFAYLWLDRWEPEPTRLLVGAFLWGGGVAAVLSFVLNTVTGMFLWPNEFLALAVGAPLFEETTKGAFLLLMMTGTRRREFNSLTDALVYSGMVGLGFAFVEDMLYFARAESLGDGLLLVIFRLLMGVFAHPLFTSMTGLGVWFATRTPNRGLRAVWVLCGFGLAMLCHGVWNGSTMFLSGWGFFVAYGVVLVPVFAGMVTLAIFARRNEGRQVVHQLPRMVAEGLVAHEDAIWLATLSRRKQRRRLVANAGGRAQRRQLNEFADRVTELALLRTRLEKHPTPEAAADHPRQVALVHEARQQAMPLLARVHGVPSMGSFGGSPQPPVPQGPAGHPGHPPAVPGHPAHGPGHPPAAGGPPITPGPAQPAQPPSWGTAPHDNHPPRA